MSSKKFDELTEVLNFHDGSVGEYALTVKDEENISSILKEFGYTPLGYYQTKNSEGFKFTDGKHKYVINEQGEGVLEIFDLIEL